MSLSHTTIEKTLTHKGCQCWWGQWNNLHDKVCWIKLLISWLAF